MYSHSLSEDFTAKYPDLLERAVQLVVSQYKDSPNFIKYVKCFASVFNDVMGAIAEVNSQRYLDYAYGAQLDVIGVIVGQSRTLAASKPLGYFGYYDNPQAEDPSVGTDKDATIGGIFKGDYDKDSADFVLNDADYIDVIKAKILKNSSNCPVDDVLAFVDLILGRVVDLEITESETTNAAHLRFHLKLSAIDKSVLSCLIKTMKVGGVRYTMEDDGGIIDINSEGPNIVN